MQNTNPPTVTARPSAVGLSDQILVSTMFSVFDPDPGAEVVLYQIRDNGVDGGFFERGGVRQDSNVWIDITPEELSLFTYRGDTVFSTETFSVRVNDGLFLSNEALANITSGNSSPVVTASDGRVNPGQSKRIDSQFSVADADGDSITEYVFIDVNLDADSGYFTLRGNRIFAQQFTIESFDLPDVEFVGGNAGDVRVDPIRVQAFDGFSYSEQASFTMFTTTAPVVTVTPVTVLTEQRRPVLTMFDVEDLDGDDVDFYKFADYNPNVGGGYFEYDGMMMPSATWFNVPADEIGTVFYVGAETAPQAERIGVQVFDGFQFSNISDAFVRTIERPNISATRPVTVQANQYLNFATGTVNNQPGIISGFDPFLDFGEGTERFEFIDLRSNSDGGFFKFMGAEIPQTTWFTVEIDELPLLEYRGGIVGPQSEGIRARAFANGVWSPVTEFELTTLENIFAPELTMFNTTARLGASVALEAIFTASDGDNDALQRFGIFDTGPELDSGYFTVNGVVQPALTWIILDYDQVGNVRYHFPDVPGEENIRMFVNDGRISSSNEFAVMSAIPTPKIEALENDISVDTLEGVAASSLIIQTDAGPAFTQYQVFDENFDMDPNTPPADRSGRLFLRDPGPGNTGEALQGGVMHTLTAEQFSRLELQGAEVDLGRQLDPILVRATNGLTGWSEWERVNVNTDPVGADALTQLPIHTAVIDGDKTVITYTFIDGGNQEGGVRGDPPGPNYPPLPIYYPPNATAEEVGREALGTRVLDQPSREMHREVLEMIESMVNIDFVEVPFTLDAAEASITFGMWGGFDGPVADAAAYAYAVADGDGRGNFFGDIWYNTDDFLVNGEDVSKGSFFRSTVIHEIGHAIGLSHPFDGNPFLSVFNNFQYNTIMAYERDNENNPLGVYPEESSTLMLYDVVALQEQYGANSGFNSNDNHYFFSTTEQHQETIWDGGGNDTINFTNHTVDERIDLREGVWFTWNGVEQSLRIAYGADIENARGGSGNDMIIGNEGANLLMGNGGNDMLRGGGDNDVVRAGAGDDTYIWSLGDGRDVLLEDGLGGLDTMQFFDPSGSITTLEDDFIFRRFGDDFRIDLTFNQGPSQGSVVMKNFADVASQVEVLQIHGIESTQIGENIDLVSIFDQSTNLAQRFMVTGDAGANGFIAVPV